MKKIFKNLKLTTKLIFIQNMLYLLFGLLIYPLIPYLLNYPPYSVDTQFQVDAVGMKYTVQFILIFLVGFLENTIILYYMFRKLNNWKDYVQNNKKEDIKNIYKIRNLCANGMYKLIPIQVTLSAIILFIILTLASTEIMLTLKLATIICVWIAVSDLLLYVFTGKIFENILKNTYEIVKDKKDKISRLNIRPKIMFQYISCLLVLIIIMTLFGYSRILYERGEFLKEKELNLLTEEINENPDKILEEITNGDTNYFVLDSNGTPLLNSYKVTKFAIEYILHYPELERTYYQYGSSIEGVFKVVEYNSSEYYVGKMYNVMPISYAVIFLIFDLGLFILYIIVIECFTRNISNQTENITERLEQIGKKNVELTTQLPITSNDEFSDLVNAYNDVQKRTQKYIEQIEEKQDIIVKQGQLASIGELAGGVAHDINTPISAIKTGILMLNQNESRTEEEKQILERMDNCATKIINIVNSMRNQIRNLGGDTNVEFKISDVANDIKIITYHEAKKNNSEVTVEIKDDLKIQGDPTKLGQVLTNLVVNGIQAYKEKNGGKVEITVTKADSKTALIKVKDYAGGLDDSIAPFIFKNILTTKGTNGTGLGLYLAYSVIKGNFNGDITFDTIKGEGTTFNITIPLK